MFKCAKCETGTNKRGRPKKGNTKHGDKQTKVISVVRKVEYLIKIRYEKFNNRSMADRIILFSIVTVFEGKDELINSSSSAGPQIMKLQILMFNVSSKRTSPI